ncbi:MAG: prephenate dehydratase domain-containing protein [Clostridia bacterium]
MSELDELRKQIDDIDKSIVQLYEKRLGIVEKVAEFKKNNHTSVLQQNRELEVLKNAENCLANKNYAGQARDLMQAIMDISKDYQRIKINQYPSFDFEKTPFLSSAKKGFFGEKGSNTWQAMADMFGDDNGSQFDSFEGIFEAINNGDITYGILPIENSSTGAIVDVYDLLKKFDFYIIGERWQRIEHQLFGVEGASIDDIDTVFSHAQAINQCDEFFKGKNIQLTSYKSTAGSAKFVAQSNNKKWGAIASDGVGKLHGLQVLKKNIQNNSENFTRFIVVSKTLCDENCTMSGKPCNKVSIVFDLQNIPSSLYNTLRCFSKLNINLIKIESRPVKNNPCNYYFFVDIDGNLQNKDIEIALDFVKQSSDYFKFLGEYTKGEIV